MKRNSALHLWNQKRATEETRFLERHLKNKLQIKTN